MTELSQEGRAALARLRAQRGGEEESERVRARLVALGALAASTSALTLSAGAAAASASSAPLAAPLSSAVGVSTGANLMGAATASSAPTASVGASAALSAAASSGAVTHAPLLGAGLLAKLASVPTVLKATAALSVLASAATVPFTLHSRSDAPRRAPVVAPAAASPRARAERPVMRHQDPPAEPAAALGKQVDGPPAEQTPSPPSALAPAPPSTPELAAPRAVLPRTAALVARRNATPRAARSRLSEESTLLQAALDAMRAGERQRAEELLERHRQQFGEHALLSRERERIRSELSQFMR